MAKLRIGDAYIKIGDAFVSIGPNASTCVEGNEEFSPFEFDVSYPFTLPGVRVSYMNLTGVPAVGEDFSWDVPGWNRFTIEPISSNPNSAWWKVTDSDVFTIEETVGPSTPNQWIIFHFFTSCIDPGATDAEIEAFIVAEMGL